MSFTYLESEKLEAIPINSYVYSKGGDWIVMKVPKMLLVFSRGEFLKAQRRGKSTLRAYQHAKRKRQRDE